LILRLSTLRFVVHVNNGIELSGTAGVWLQPVIEHESLGLEMIGTSLDGLVEAFRSPPSDAMDLEHWPMAAAGESCPISSP